MPGRELWRYTGARTTQARLGLGDLFAKHDQSGISPCMADTESSSEHPNAPVMTPAENFAYTLERAEAGHPSFQYFASQLICASNDYPDRQVVALKWLLIAGVLDDASAPEEVRHYLSSVMSPEDTARAFKLAEDWFEEKARTGIPQDESLWSRSLLKLMRPDPPH